MDTARDGTADLSFVSRSREARAKGLLFRGAAISFVASVSLWFVGNELQGIYVGLWVPSILALGSIVLPQRARS